MSLPMAGSGLFAEITDGDVFKYYADGEWKKSSSGKSVAIVNPTTRKTQYKVQGSNNHQLTCLPCCACVVKNTRAC